MAKQCKGCANCGAYPLCWKCGRDSKGQFPRLIQYQIEKERIDKARKKRDAKDLSREEIIKEECQKEDDKLLAVMFKNMRKCNMTTTGCPNTDARIYELFGLPETWE